MKALRSLWAVQGTPREPATEPGRDPTPDLSPHRETTDPDDQQERPNHEFGQLRLRMTEFRVVESVQKERILKHV
jgi:hypothetical protein